MNKTNYESRNIFTIANNRYYIEKDLIAIDTPDGFVSLSIP